MFNLFWVQLKLSDWENKELRVSDFRIFLSRTHSNNLSVFLIYFFMPLYPLALSKRVLPIYPLDRINQRDLESFKECDDNPTILFAHISRTLQVYFVFQKILIIRIDSNKNNWSQGTISSRKIFFKLYEPNPFKIN